MSEKHIIAMWSGPRNLSTAMMRSFENRPDTSVWDEPFYAAYLQDTGLQHPMASTVRKKGITDWRTIVEACQKPALQTNILYQKHMTHHMLPAYTRSWIGNISNAFLIRDPASVVASYGQKHGELSLSDIGFWEQIELFNLVCDLYGKAPPVINAIDIRNKPETALRALCQALGIVFSTHMLSWPAGPRNSDGIWAEHWYDSVIASTGFAPPELATPNVPDRYKSIVEQATPLYEHMNKYALPV